jgi:hypothetical protein
MSELKQQILRTLSQMREEQQEMMQHLLGRVDRLEKELTTAKQFQSHLDKSLSVVVQLSEKLLEDSSRQ